MFVLMEVETLGMARNLGWSFYAGAELSLGAFGGAANVSKLRKSAGHGGF
jgi:hypothetical protein